jgi:hypothetical protein
VGNEGIKNLVNETGQKGDGRDYTNLAVVEGTLNSKVEDVLVRDGRHLSLLNGGNATLGVEDEDGDVLLRPETVDCGAVGRGG